MISSSMSLSPLHFTKFDDEAFFFSIFSLLIFVVCIGSGNLGSCFWPQETEGGDESGEKKSVEFLWWKLEEIRSEMNRGHEICTAPGTRIPHCWTWVGLCR